MTEMNNLFRFLDQICFLLFQNSLLPFFRAPFESLSISMGLTIKCLTLTVPEHTARSHTGYRPTMIPRLELAYFWPTNVRLLFNNNVQSSKTVGELHVLKDVCSKCCKWEENNKKLFFHNRNQKFLEGSEKSKVFWKYLDNRKDMEVRISQHAYL